MKKIHLLVIKQTKNWTARGARTPTSLMPLFTRGTSRPQQSRQSRAQPRGPAHPTRNLRNISSPVDPQICLFTTSDCFPWTSPLAKSSMRAPSFSTIGLDHRAFSSRNRDFDSPPSLWIVSCNFRHQDPTPHSLWI